MSSDSNTSSVKAQNGSSYGSDVEFTSQESHPSSTHSTDCAQDSRYPVGVPHNRGAITTAQDTRAVADGYLHSYDYAGNCSDGNSYNSYTNGDYPQSASSYNAYSPSDHSQDVHSAGQGYQQRRYYLPPTSYPQETPNYDPEIIIDSIEDEQDSPHYSIQPEHGSGRARSQQPSAARRTPQNPQQSNVAPTPTVRRWSREYSPEERMRVGLPRRETEYERQQRQGRHRS